MCQLLASSEKLAEDLMTANIAVSTRHAAVNVSTVMAPAGLQAASHPHVDERARMAAGMDSKNNACCACDKQEESPSCNGI